MTNKQAVQELLGDHPTIWVFGYGSLLWKPDFRYKSKEVGYIEDYERRFYQGNVTFRGKPGQPGRVANLVETKGSQAWGVAYEISGREEVTEVLQALYARETTSGGYVTMVTTFYPRDYSAESKSSSLSSSSSKPAVPVVKLSPAESDDSMGDSSDSDSSSSTELFEQYLSDSSMRRVESEMSIADSSSDESSDDSEEDSDADNAEQHHSRNSTEADRLHYRERNQESKPVYDSLISQHSENAVSLKHPSDSKNRTSVSSKQPVQVLLYTATPDNDLYLGADDVNVMAKQIVHASGSAGTNVEYVTKIADYVRRYIPEDEDSHLFHLDAKIREEVYNLYAKDPSRLHASLTGLIQELSESEHESLIEPVRAS